MKRIVIALLAGGLSLSALTLGARPALAEPLHRAAEESPIRTRAERRHFRRVAFRREHHRRLAMRSWRARRDCR